MEHDTESRGNGLPRLKAEDPQGENDCVFFMFKDREPKVVREEETAVSIFLPVSRSHGSARERALSSRSLWVLDGFNTRLAA